MISSTLHQFHIITQDRAGARFTVEGEALTKLIHNLIREHGKYNSCDYTVDLRDFDTIDKKLVLSHILEPFEYAEAISSPTRLEAEFWEHSKFIEIMISENSSEVYQEDMEEMRSYK